MTFDLATEIAEANADYFNEASAHDRAEEARKFAVALNCVLDDGRREAGWRRHWISVAAGAAK